LVGLLAAGPARGSAPFQESPTSQSQPAVPPSESRPAGSQPSSAPGSAPTSAPEPADLLAAEGEPAAVDLSRDAIEARIKQASSATDLAEEVRAELLQWYRQALDQVIVADMWRGKIADYEKRRAEAPTELEKVRKAISDMQAREPAAAPAVAERSLEELNRELANAEAELAERREAVGKLETEVKNRAERRKSIPGDIAAATERLEGAAREIDAALPADLPPPVAVARRMALQAQTQAIESELRAYQEEQRFYEARTDLLAARQELAGLKLAEAEAAAAAWQAAISERRQAEIERQKKQAQEELERALAPLRDVAQRNAELVHERDGLTSRMDAVKGDRDQVQQRLKALTSDLEGLKKYAATPGLEDYVGGLMRGERAELAKLRLDYERALRRIEAEINQAQLRAAQLAGEELNAAALLDRLRAAGHRVDAAPVEAQVQGLVGSRTSVVEQLTVDYDNYGKGLVDLNGDTRDLLARVNAALKFIDEHVLWLRSAEPLYRLQLPRDWAPLRTAWSALAPALGRDLRVDPVRYAAALLLLLLLLSIRRRLVARLRALGQQTAQPERDSFLLTFEALVYTALYSVIWPSALWFASWRVAGAASPSDESLYETSQLLATALFRVGRLLFLFTLLRELLRPWGLAEAHFLWRADAIRYARRHLLWLTLVLLPAGFLVFLTDHAEDTGWRDAFGRPLFLVGMGALAIFLQRVLRPDGPVLGPALEARRGGLLDTWRYVWFGTAVGAPLALALTSAIGYHYTAAQIASRLVESGFAGLTLLVLHALLVRWLMVAQRRLHLQQQQRKRAAGEAEAQETAERIVAISDQTRRILNSLTVLGLVLGFWIIWADMLPALSFMEKVRLWSYTVETAGAEDAVTKTVVTITLAHLALATIILIATLVLARNIPGVLEIVVLQRLPLDAGARFAISTVARYLITAVGVVAAFSSIGARWSQVQWLVAAFGVGLGFGLQEIFANFVSGLVILFERPIRVGDIVTIGDQSGTVTRIRIRATTLTNADRKELIIPNKEFVTGRIINWTLSDPILRLVIRLGVAHGSDTRLARDLLLKVANANQRVLVDPPPQVLFQEFGESALLFELSVYFNGIENWAIGRHELNMAIDEAFRAAGVEIPFPQRDIHIRSAEAVLPLIREQNPQLEPQRRPAAARARVANPRE